MVGRRLGALAAGLGLATSMVSLGVGPPGASGATSDLPALEVEVVVDGLTIPWDLAFPEPGVTLFTERGGSFGVIDPDGGVRTLAADLSDLAVARNGGLLSIDVAPDFATTRRVVTCQTTTGPTVEVVGWTVDEAYTTLTREFDPLVGGIPTVELDHVGCRVRFGPDGHLWVATGDAITSSVPQDLTSLGGKFLRVDPLTGQGAPDNPFSANPNVNTRRIVTFGHRNPQGLAFRPLDGTAWGVEHGTDVDDEINRLVPGGNYGWDPGPGYDQSVPMTDLVRHPDAIEARWRSGDPTFATSGADWLTGAGWGPWEGWLAVATLKNRTLELFGFDAGGALIGRHTPIELDGTHGRLRTARTAPDGSLWLTTSNGGGTDEILRVIPPDPPPPPPTTGPSTTAPPTPELATSAGYVPVGPVRIVDTRIGTGAPAARLDPAATLRLDLDTVAPDVPDPAAALVLNLTATESTAPSFLTVWGGSGDRPATSSLNTEPGQDTANLALARLDTGRTLTIYNDAGTTHLVVDVLGVVTRGRGFPGLAPRRLLDTRAARPALDRSPRPVDVGAGSTGAVLVNLTSTEATRASFVTAWPAGTVQPATSNLNTEPGQDVANLALVDLRADGVLLTANENGTTHLVVDLVAAFDTGSTLQTVPARRLFDSRSRPDRRPLAAGEVVRLDPSSAGVPESAVAVVVNLTSTDATAPTFLTLWPTGGPRPATSNLNTEPGQDTANLAIVGIGADGGLSLYHHAGEGQVIVDLLGWFDGT